MNDPRSMLREAHDVSALALINRLHLTLGRKFPIGTLKIYTITITISTQKYVLKEKESVYY